MQPSRNSEDLRSMPPPDRVPLPKRGAFGGGGGGGGGGRLNRERNNSASSDSNLHHHQQQRPRSSSAAAPPTGVSDGKQALTKKNSWRIFHKLLT